jgi:cell division transport system permease protein
MGVQAPIHRTLKGYTRVNGVSTVIGISLVLFMLGILGFLVLNARSLTRYFKENIRVDLFLAPSLNEVEVLQFQKQLDLRPGTRTTRYITSDAAAEQLRADLGEDFLGVLGSNPLHASIEMNLKEAFAHPDSMRQLVAELRKDVRVHDVAYNATVVENIDRNLRRVSLILLGFSALLLLIAIALINNTIRLAIYSKRFLIRTMHLVGATHWFIKRPFIGQSLWHGLIAGVLASGLIAATLRLAVRYVPDVLALSDLVVFAQVFLGVLLLGLLISVVSTWFAVRRYLRMNLEELHWS